MDEMCKEWLKKTGRRDAKSSLRYILYRGLEPDGKIKMTEGWSSDLTIEFTNILNSLEVFKRNGLLVPREIDMCLSKFVDGKTNEDLAEIYFYSVSQTKKIISGALDKVLAKVCAE